MKKKKSKQQQLKQNSRTLHSIKKIFPDEKGCKLIALFMCKVKDTSAPKGGRNCTHDSCLNWSRLRVDSESHKEQPHLLLITAKLKQLQWRHLRGKVHAPRGYLHSKHTHQHKYTLLCVYAGQLMWCWGASCGISMRCNINYATLTDDQN